jgi:hypothetical protein
MKGLMTRLRWALGVAALALHSAPDARAEGQSDAAAEALFREGRALLQEGRTAEACEKFAQSQRLDASSGTAINLAACYETQGKTASAWATYLVAARIAESQQKTERAEEATRKASELEKKLSYLTVKAGEKVPGLQVRVGGVLLEQSSIGAKIPTDPGEHVVEVSAPGYKAATVGITLGTDGDARVLDLPTLEKLPEEIAQPKLSGAEESHSKANPTTNGADTGGHEPSRTVPYIIGGSGIGLVVLGGVFGVLAMSSNSEAKSLCNGKTTDCPSSALTRQDTAYAQANTANVLVGVGFAGIATSAIWLLLSSGDAPKASTTAWRFDGAVGNGTVGASVRGRF